MVRHHFSCSSFIRFLRHGHVGLTNHHSAFPCPRGASLLGLYLSCREPRSRPAPDSRSLGTQPCRTSSCPGPPTVALTSQAGGLWVGVCGSLTVTQGLGPAGSALKPTLAGGHSWHVAAFLPHTFTLMSAIKRCPRAGPETTLS